MKFKRKSRFPEIKKKIMDFITKEDAKVVESSTAKVAITITLLSASLLSMDTVFAGKKKLIHGNDFVPGINGRDSPPQLEQHMGINFNEEDTRMEEINEFLAKVAKKRSSDIPDDFLMQGKSVVSFHGDHYNWVKKGKK